MLQQHLLVHSFLPDPSFSCPFPSTPQLPSSWLRLNLFFLPSLCGWWWWGRSQPASKHPLLMFYTATPFLPTTLATAPQRDQYQGFLNFKQRARCTMIATGVCCPTQEIWWIFSAAFKKQLRRGGSGLAGKVPLCQITFCQGLLPRSLVGLVGQPSPPGSLIMMSDCHLLCLCLYYMCSNMHLLHHI